MAIFTLADMQARSQRSSSIPRQYHRMADAAHDHRFSVADAVQLKLQLRALHEALAGTFTEQTREHDITSIDKAVHLQSRYSIVYVAGSEEFFLVVKRVSRPDLIPNVFAEACKAMLHGRPYVNRYNVSDFKKGVDPTFSEIRSLLPDIDRACETDLDSAVARLETRVAPFPFLRLPAELRLHVYSYLVPHQRRQIPPPSYRKVTALRLTLMRVNKQMHYEVRKYFYERVTLFTPLVFQPQNTSLYQTNEYPLRYKWNAPSLCETIAGMDPDVLPFLKRLSIHIEGANPPPRRTEPNTSSRVLKYMFDTLTGLETLSVTFGGMFCDYMWAEHGRESAEQKCVEEMQTRFIDHIPKSVKISWPREEAGKFFDSDVVGQCLWTAIQERASTDTKG